VSISVTALGIDTFINEEQLLKEEFPIDFKEVESKVTLVKLTQPLKAAFPNCVNNDALVQIKSVITVLLRNILDAVLVTESGMVATVVP